MARKKPIFAASKKKRRPDQYSGFAKFLHWSMAVLILLMLSAGFFMVKMDFAPVKLQVYGLHKSVGMLLLVLVFIRLAWQLASPPPASIGSHAVWEKILSKATHVALYCLIILMTMSGWIMTSAGDFPNTFFGLFEVPDLIAKDLETFKLSRKVHEIVGFVILGLVGLHMLGAFKHAFLDDDETLKRMTSKKMGLLGLCYLSVIFGALWLGPLTIINQKDPGKITRLLEAVFPGGDNQLVDPGVDDGEVPVLQPEKHTDAQDVPEDVSDVSAPNTPEQQTLDHLDTLWTIDHEESALTFTATQYGSEFSGAFEVFVGDIRFDPENLAESMVAVEIDLTSIKTGSEDRDSQALGSDWFATAQFPKAYFRADQFEKLDANRYSVEGTLSIRDTAQNLSFPFTLEIDSDDSGVQIAKMNAEFTLNRIDFNVGQGEWSDGEAIGKEVKMQISLEASRANPSDL